MAFKKVAKTPTFKGTAQIANLKREYRALTRKYDDAKYRFKHALEANDFKSATMDEYLKLKEMYILKKHLFWKIHELEHPEDTATREAYRFLDSLTEQDKIDFLVNHHMSTHDLIREIEKNPNFIAEVTA